MTKKEQYLKLVEKRKRCNECTIGLQKNEEPGLLNPSQCSNDSNHVGPWSRWQGNLDTEIMIVGQDWGDDQYFKDNNGFDKTRTKSGSPYENPTNKTLRYLLQSIGINIEPCKDYETEGDLFFTNAILCLKNKGRMQGPVKDEWFKNCGSLFLKPLIDIISPKVVITLGEKAYRAVCNLYDIDQKKNFKDAVNNYKGVPLVGSVLLFPVYHCGNRTINKNRKLPEQKRDWERIKYSTNQ
jgi:uracil-DNA glycosylase family 4